MQKRILSLLVDNTAGVLSRISGLFSRRGYNIDSLTVGVTADERYSRMTVVCSALVYYTVVFVSSDNVIVFVSAGYRSLVLFEIFLMCLVYFARFVMLMCMSAARTSFYILIVSFFF